MQKDSITSGVNRRSVLSAGLGLALLGRFPRGLAAALDPRLQDPAFNVRAFARIAGDIAPDESAIVHYRGRGFGIVAGQASIPFYGLEGAASLVTELQDDGSVRMLFNEFALYTDIDSGKPIHSWINPITGERVPVWHQRNGPINLTISPYPEGKVGKFSDYESRRGFTLPWRVEDDTVSFVQDVRSERENQLDGRRYPAHYSGEKLLISEHSQYFLSLSDLLDETLSSIPYRAALQSIKPWHPWMQFGAMPGRVFTRMTARKITSLDALSGSVREYAMSELKPFTQPPERWTGSYKDAYSLFKAELELGLEPRRLQSSKETSSHPQEKQ